MKQEHTYSSFITTNPSRSTPTTMLNEVIEGLQKKQKTLPCKYFYDDHGSQLFEQICELQEYYPMRTELSIMPSALPEIVTLIGTECMLIEYGSGSSTKTKMFLDALESPVAYVPIDISKELLMNSARELSASYPYIEILPVCGDYTGNITIPTPSKHARRKIIYFPGSTIGNFDPQSAELFLRKIGAISQGGSLLIGVDLKKDFTLLHQAYNDAQGITAQFNKNILKHINTQLHANFKLDQFEHYAFYNPHEGRIEMHLVSLKEQCVDIGNTKIYFTHGESIWTESSCKYTLKEFAELAATAGFQLERAWTDPNNLFSVQYYTLL